MGAGCKARQIKKNLEQDNNKFIISIKNVILMKNLFCGQFENVDQKFRKGRECLISLKTKQTITVIYLCSEKFMILIYQCYWQSDSENNDTEMNILLLVDQVILEIYDGWCFSYIATSSQ